LHDALSLKKPDLQLFIENKNDAKTSNP